MDERSNKKLKENGKELKKKKKKELSCSSLLRNIKYLQIIVTF